MKAENVMSKLISVTLILVFLGSSAFADLVYLKDGRVLEGRITEEADTTVRIESKDYKKIINRMDIELMLKDISPNESASYIFNQRFSLDNALWRRKQVTEALQSFRKLTEKCQSRLTKDELSEIGKTDLETQYLGFVNWVSAIEGTLRKQNYQIAKLELELIREKSKVEKVEKKEIEKKEQNYEKAKSQFQTFWNSFSVAD